MLEEHVSLGGELDAPGISEKKPGPQAFLQLSNGLADGRLADIQFFCSPGDIAAPGHFIKYTVLRQMLLHIYNSISYLTFILCISIIVNPMLKCQQAVPNERRDSRWE